MIIGDMWRALRSGEELANSAAWKNRQATTSAVAAILGLAVALLPKLGVAIEISADDVAAVAGGVAAVLGLLNGYLTAATSRKIGLPGADQATPPAGPDAIAAGVGD